MVTILAQRIWISVILLSLLDKFHRKENNKHGCPSGPRGYVKAVMCSHSRVRVPLRAFFFSCFTESMTKADSRVVDSGSKFAEMYSFVLTLIIRVLFLCSRFPIQCSKQFRDCLLVAEYCLKELSDSVFMFSFSHS